jgi:hypothetical protein
MTSRNTFLCSQFGPERPGTNLFLIDEYVLKKSYYMTVQGAETAECLGFLNPLMPLLTK